MRGKYNLILKTGEAEVRAVKKSRQSVLKAIFPLIELTRGRRSSKDADGASFTGKLELLQELFKDSSVAIDLTSMDSLMNNEIRRLYAPEEGFSNYVSFLENLKARHFFKEIQPCLIVNYTADDYVLNLKEEARRLWKSFESLIYRNSIDDIEFGEDLAAIVSVMPRDKRLTFLIDCGFITEGQVELTAQEISARVIRILEFIKTQGCAGKLSFMVAATSFPSNISEVSSQDEDSIAISEIELHAKVSELVMANADVRELKEKPVIEYADYGSIAEKRNDEGFIHARGWIPRIDVPFYNAIAYIRQRRSKGQSEYATVYNAIALKVYSFLFPQVQISQQNWGISMIDFCSRGFNPGSTPSFWISVRMNIHLETQCQRMGLLGGA